jgi:ubiquinone/menaquinone biosynthesis C-methylase UbiE
MDDKDVEKYWNQNAENWAKLVRMGYDITRIYLNNPGFFKILPDISGLRGLDVGCGEGYNTRIFAQKGAQMTGIDISKKLIQKARKIEHKNPQNIIYEVSNSSNLSFEDKSFDFALSTMALMDMANIEKPLTEVYRVLKKGGFFQFSILHPCFSSTYNEWTYDEKGKKIGMVCKGYFNEDHEFVEEWIFGDAPRSLTDKMKKFRVPRFQRTLSTWVNTIISSGFQIEEFHEPHVSKEAIEKHPSLYDCNIIAQSLIIRCKK